MLKQHEWRKQDGGKPHDSQSERHSVPHCMWEKKASGGKKKPVLSSCQIHASMMPSSHTLETALYVKVVLDILLLLVGVAASFAIHDCTRITDVPQLLKDASNPPEIT